MVRWLRELIGSRPTVVAIEDVHWADESSLALTAELAELAAETRLVLFLVARPEAGPRLEDVAGAARTLALEPLGPSDVAELLSDLLPEVPPGLAETVHERTGGNAFFVGELARALDEQGTPPEELPPTIEGVLAARIDSLPNPRSRCSRPPR